MQSYKMNFTMIAAAGALASKKFMHPVQQLPLMIGPEQSPIILANVSTVC